MPPAAKESHPPPGIPNEPEDAEGEESDDYDIGVGGNPILGCFGSLLNSVPQRMMMMNMLEKTTKRKVNQME